MNAYLNILDLIATALKTDVVKRESYEDNLMSAYLFYLEKTLGVLLKDVLNPEKPNIEFFRGCIDLISKINAGISIFSNTLDFDFEEIDNAGVNKDDLKSNKSDKYDILLKLKGEKIANEVFIESLIAHLIKKFERYISKSFEAFMSNNLDVAYTLLRIPYFDIQFYFERLVCEPNDLLNDILYKEPKEYDYISRYKDNEKKITKIKEVISNSFEKINQKKITDHLLNAIYSIRYNTSSEFNMLNLIQKSNHIITTSKTGGSSKGEINFTFLSDKDVVLPIADYYLSLGVSMLRNSMISIFYLFMNHIVHHEKNASEINSDFLVDIINLMSDEFKSNGANQSDLDEMIGIIKTYNDAHQDDLDNHADQLNQNNDEYKGDSKEDK